MICGVAPGVMVADGAKEAVAPAGNAEILNVTGSEKLPFAGEMVNVNFAVCPAVIGGLEMGELTE